MKSCNKYFARSVSSLLLLIQSGLFGTLPPQADVIPFEHESAVTRSLDELGKMITLLGRTNMLPDATILRPEPSATFPDAPEPVMLLEGALDHVRAGVRYVPIEFLGGFLQSNENAQVIFLKPGIPVYDRGVTNTQTTIGLSALITLWRRFMSADAQAEWETEATRLALQIVAVGPTGRAMPGRGASLEASLFRQRRGRRAALVFDGSGANAIRSVVWLDGPTSALRVLAERALLLTISRLLEIPFWKCSALDQFDERMPRFWRESFDGFDELTRLVHVQLLLRANGFQYVRVTGAMDDPTRTACEIFRLRRDMPPRSALDADLFVELNMAVPSTAAEVAVDESRIVRVHFTGRHAAAAVPALASLWAAPGLGLVEVREAASQPPFGNRVKTFFTGNPSLPRKLEFALRLSGESWKVESALREATSKLAPRFEWKSKGGVEVLWVRCD